MWDAGMKLPCVGIKPLGASASATGLQMGVMGCRCGRAERCNVRLSRRYPRGEADMTRTSGFCSEWPEPDTDTISHVVKIEHRCALSSNRL
jgi:hypothetical protein